MRSNSPPERLRVAITAEQLLRPIPGGVGTYTEQLIRAYGRAFDAPLVLTSRPSRRNDRDLGFGGEHRATPFPHRLGGRLWEREVLAAPRRLRTFDVLHATSFHFPRVAKVRACQDGLRLSVFVHDLAWRIHPEFVPARGRAFHDRGLDRARQHAEWLLVPSQRTARDLIGVGIPDSKVFVVGEGSDHLPAPAAVRKVPAKPYLMTVSTIEPRKNLGNLMRAYEIAKRGSAAFPDLVVVGAPGWSGTADTSTPRSVDGVRFAGQISNQALADLYADALAFVYVPHLEGFGLPPLEAMHAGVPVVASSAVPSVTESTESDHEPAQIVNAGDVEAIAMAITRIVADPELRAELVSRGAVHAEHQTWDRVARRHHDVWIQSMPGRDASTGQAP